MAFGGLAATALTRAKAFTTVRNSNVVFQEEIQDRYRFITGSSPAMQEVLSFARTAAATATTVLLLGEVAREKNGRAGDSPLEPASGASVCCGQLHCAHR